MINGNRAGVLASDRTGSDECSPDKPGLPRMRVCHVTSVHAWNDVRIFARECKSLAAAGFEVHLVAARGPAFPVAQPGAVPSHAVVGMVDGVHVHLLYARPIRSRLARAVLLASRVAAYARRLNADLYHLHDPELLPHAAWRFRDRLTVYDIHEDLALQVLSKPWVHPSAKPILATLVRIIEAPLASRCDALVGATPEVLERFRSGRRGHDAVVVENVPLRSSIAAMPAKLQSRPRRVVYVGALTPERGITDLVDAMADERLAAADGLDLAGPVAPDYLALLSQRPGFAKTCYHGMLEPSAVAGLLGGARVGVAALHPYPNYLASRPIKIFEYLAAGLNVVASDFPLWRRLYGDQPGMRFVSPKNVAALASALDEALAAPPPAGAASSLPYWEVEAAKLVSLYERLAEQRRVQPITASMMRS